VERALGAELAERSGGLTSQEAQALLREHGPNEIAREQPITAWALLVRQFKSPLIALLACACALAAALGELADAIAISAIVIANALVGFLQEDRAERSLRALRAMTSPRARVLRDGHTREVPAREVVPADVLLLEAGDVVAADARVFEAHALLANEAMLTGESVPVEKAARPSPDLPAPPERTDEVFMGTSIVIGTARAVVTATGASTEIGKIGRLIASASHEETPLQLRLARLSRVLMAACLGIVALVAVLGFVRGTPWLELLLSAVSLAVAAVPEGLPAVVTIALAIGVQRMAARHVLVRRLPAVETLGCATVICTDKTGTLTTGSMAVRDIWSEDPARMLDAAAACCDAELDASKGSGVGDPTELALLVAAAERGIARDEIEHARPRVLVHPFDSQRKRMSIRRADGTLYVKGAPESLVPLCSIGAAGATTATSQMAARGLRVLAVAVGSSDAEEDLTLLGLVGIADPPRKEVIEAVAAAQAAGIRTVMITGDHPATAHAIALELGVLQPGAAAHEVIHARATPEDKLMIVREWKRRGAVVAMTGDGVNDAPALREAHVGIAMGRGGTEVAREAADVVLTDDNFASIVAALREGRGIFDNIRKTLVYLIAGNAAELTTMLAAALFGLPPPFLPLHLLWINLATDGFPALALVMDPVDERVMQRPPRGADRPIMGRDEWWLVARSALVEAGVALGVFVWALQTRSLIEARSFAFATLVFSELMRAFPARSRSRTGFEVGLLSNVRLLAVVVALMTLQIAMHQVPAARRLLGISALSPFEWALALTLGLVPATVLELSKLLARLRKGSAQHARRGANAKSAG
jgi:Ca2+-transporting ATPase